MVQPTIIKNWNALQDSLGGILKPIESQAHYDQLAALLDELLKEVRGSKKHPLQSMVEVVTRLIQEYDAAHPVPLASPEKMLEWYMTQHQLNQSQLAAQTGLDQSLISKHLSGKRSINLAHARAYAACFAVPLEAFVR